MDFADQLGGEVSSYLNSTANEEETSFLKAQYENKVFNYLNKKLVEKGYIEKKNDEPDGYAQSFADKIKAKGMTEEKIQEYTSKGYDYVTIYNAKNISNLKNLDIDYVLNQAKNGINWSEIK